MFLNMLNFLILITFDDGKIRFFFFFRVHPGCIFVFIPSVCRIGFRFTGAENEMLANK